MQNELKKATVIKTGKVIEVYRLNNGNWCDYSDCTTQYTPKELKNIRQTVEA